MAGSPIPCRVRDHGKVTEGKTNKETVRPLKRRIIDAIYRHVPPHDNAELVAHPNAKHERVLTTKRDSFCAQLHTTLRSAPCAVDTETVGIGRKQDRQPKVCRYALADSSEEERGS